MRCFRGRGLAVTAAAGALIFATAWGGQSMAQHAHDLGIKIDPGTFSLDLDLELQNDWTTHASDGNARNNLKSEIGLGLAYQATHEISLKLGLKLEQIDDPDAGQDEAFEKHGAFVETLTVNYDTAAFGAYAGKFTPNFGRAWDGAPGIYTKAFAKEDYELAERWGFGGNYGIEGGLLGHLDLSASAFLVDRTVLSESVITSRGRTTRSSGGPANTSGPSSFAIGIDGHEVPWMETLEYHLSFVRQAKGDGDTSAETGIVAGLQFTLPLGDRVDFTPYVEYAVFDGSGGVDDRKRRVTTLAARFDYGAWNMTLGHASRVVKESGLDDARDYLHQATVGYRFDNGLMLDVGFGKIDDDGVVSDIVGFKLAYELSAFFP